MSGNKFCSPFLDVDIEVTSKKAKMQVITTYNIKARFNVGEYKTQVRSDQVRSGQVRSGQVRSGQVRSGQVRSGQVRSGQVRSGQVRSV